MMSRFRRSHYCLADTEVSEEQFASMQEKPEIAQIAEEIIQNCEAYLNADLAKGEVYYLYQYIVSSRMRRDIQDVPLFSREVEEITRYFLAEVGRRMKMTGYNDMIYVDLANHIKPMLNRLRNRIRVKNGLLSQIKLTYRDIFQYVKEVGEAASFKFQIPNLNEDEAGFITLYFARIIETHQLAIPTLIMCTTGVGTSELLRIKVQKKFPELEIVDVISSRNYRKVLAEKPQLSLLLTTIAIEEDLPVRTLLVSAMLTQDDQKRLRDVIEAIYNEK